MRDLIITKKYDNFDGRIITDEAILINDKEIPVKAEWDTGATYCVISSEFIKRFGLISNKKHEIQSTFSSELKNAHCLDLVLNHEVLVPIEASESDIIKKTGIDLLIGMEIICRGDFAISNYDGVICFSFRAPSKGLIDFGKE